jgi:D-xylose transport system ATP-binding protein
LECRQVSKNFGAVQALYKVDFEVVPGEVMALVGDNGAGKSTPIKGIAGIYPFSEGEVFFAGKPVHIHGPRDAAHLGIEIVYQDLALADNLDVVAKCSWAANANARSGGWTSPRWRNLRIETLHSLSVTTLRSVRQTVAELSGGQRQSIRSRQGGDVELEGGDPGRTNRSVWGLHRHARCSIWSPPGRQRAGRGGHFTQPARYF